MKNNELIEFLYWGGIFGIEFNIKAEMSQLSTIQTFQKWMGDLLFTTHLSKVVSGLFQIDFFV